jgi:hypothetical protein
MIGRVRKSHKRPTGMVSRAQVPCGCGRSSCPARGLELRGQSRWRRVRRKALLSSVVERKKKPRIRSHQTACLPKSQRQRQTKLDESPWIYFSAPNTPFFTRAFLRAERRPLPPLSHSIRERISSSSRSKKNLPCSENGAAGGRPRRLATAARRWPVARDRSPA